MSSPIKVTKQSGPQECENCYRWFEVTKKWASPNEYYFDWYCPFCDHDNIPTKSFKKNFRSPDPALQ
jgi:hypothetical protein